MGLDAPPAAFDYAYNVDEIITLYNHPDTWIQNGTLFKKYFSLQLDKLLENGHIDLKQYILFNNHIATSSQRTFDQNSFQVLGELGLLPIKLGANIIGNIHGLTASAVTREINDGSLLKTCQDLNIKRDSVHIYDLIRHPITRLDTYLNYKSQWYDRQMYGDYVKKGADDFINSNIDLVRDIEQRFNVDFSLTRNKVFLWDDYSRKNSNHLVENFRDITSSPLIKRITFENIRHNPDQLLLLLKKVTSSNEYLSELLSNIYSTENMMRGRASDIKNQHDRSDPELCYDSWSDWEKDRFRDKVTTLHLDSFYRQFGYDLSFVTKKHHSNGTNSL